MCDKLPAHHRLDGIKRITGNKNEKKKIFAGIISVGQLYVFKLNWNSLYDVSYTRITKSKA